MTDRAPSPPPGAPGRLPLLATDRLDTSQRKVYDAIAAGRRADGPFRLLDDEGRLLGPFNALLYGPHIGNAVQQLGAALRFEGTLAARTRELVICAVAVHWSSAYEWYAHSRVALSVGVSQQDLDCMRHGKLPEDLSPAESAALRLAHALLRDRVVDQVDWDAAVRHHENAGAVELAVLVGYYQTLAGLLAAVDVPAPAD